MKQKKKTSQVIYEGSLIRQVSDFKLATAVPITVFSGSTKHFYSWYFYRSHLVPVPSYVPWPGIRHSQATSGIPFLRESWQQFVHFSLGAKNEMTFWVWELHWVKMLHIPQEQISLETHFSWCLQETRLVSYESLLSGNPTYGFLLNNYLP